MRERLAVLRARLERLLVWRVWERMLEIEFVDRSVALAGKAFVSFFPLVIVVAAFVPRASARRSSPPSPPASASGATRSPRPGRRSPRRRTSERRPGCSGWCSRSSSRPRSRPRCSASTSARGGARPGRRSARTGGALHGCRHARVHGIPRRVAWRLGNGAGLGSSRCCHSRRRHAVVVHRLVPPARRGARAGPGSFRRDHEHRVAGFAVSATIWMPDVVLATKSSSASSASRSRWSPGSRARRSAFWSARAPDRCSRRTRDGRKVRPRRRPDVDRRCPPAASPARRELSLRDAFTQDEGD